MLGSSSKISSASVPAPAATSRWSYAWLKRDPRVLAYSIAASDASAYSAPTCRTSAPYSRIRSILTNGAVSGTNTVALTPSVAAAYALASPALPPEAITTPADGSSSPRSRAARRRLKAPRVLNTPVCCRNSHFSQSGAVRVSGRSSGVRRT